MSATGRKKKPKKGQAEGERTIREKQNHYPTPPWCTRVLIEHIGFDLAGKNVLECAAGDGAMVKVLHEAGAQIDAVEIDEERARVLDGLRVDDRRVVRRVLHGDFLGPTIARALDDAQYDAVISNPPYGEHYFDGRGKKKYRDLALEFVQRALTMSPVVAMLLRVNWTGSAGRHDFHKAHPADLVVMSNRPNFKPGSDSDSAEYAWWIWRRGATVGTWTVHLTSEVLRGKPRRVLVKPGESVVVPVDPGETYGVEVFGGGGGVVTG